MRLVFLPTMPKYAIGDIHGCFTALRTLWHACEPAADDLVVFLGDYVDRGPSSADVIQWIIDLEHPNLITLRGNHEVMMLDFRKEAPFHNGWLEFGGRETLASYGADYNTNWHKEIPAKHWQFLESTRPYYEINQTVFVHAAVEPKVPMQQQLPRTLFWEKMVNPKAYLPGYKVICGHTSQKNGEIADWGHTICIDTFVYGGMWLTCLEIDSGQFWQANEQGELKTGFLRDH